jgi:hypothetical protein
VAAAIAAEDLPAEDIAADHRAAAIAVATPEVVRVEGAPILPRAARRAVAVVIAAEALRVEDIAAGHRAEVIVVATPEVVRVAVRPAEVLRLQAGTLRQETTAVDSSRTGTKPASSHRQEGPKGASCFLRKREQ